MQKQIEKLNAVQLKDFADKVIQRVIKYPRLRRGQHISDIFSDEYTTLAVQVFSEGLDPYYDDRKIQLFLHAIATEEAINELHGGFFQ
jgi:hypothetical protein